MERAVIRQKQGESEDRRLPMQVIQNSEPLLQGWFKADEVCLPGTDTAIQLSVTTLMIISSVNTPVSSAAPHAASDPLNWLLHKDT